MADRIITFLKDARTEIKKVIWPTRQQAIRYTLGVIVISLAVSLFLGGLDFVFTFILNTFVL